MSCIAGLLQDLAPDLEARIQPQLKGVFGGVVRGYLPQGWEFRTESEKATLSVDREGKVRAIPGAAKSPDVTIDTSHSRLEAALRTRRRESVPPGPLAVTPHTEKGRTAFAFLRSRLGL